MNDINYKESIKQKRKKKKKARTTTFKNSIMKGKDKRMTQLRRIRVSGKAGRKQGTMGLNKPVEEYFKEEGMKSRAKRS